MYTIDKHEYNRYTYLLYQSPDCISVYKIVGLRTYSNIEIVFFAPSSRIQSPNKYLIDFAKTLLNCYFKLHLDRKKVGHWNETILLYHR
jgi:hypothetical protein